MGFNKVVEYRIILIYISEFEREQAFSVFLKNLGQAFIELGYNVIYIDMGNLYQLEMAIELLMRDEVLCSIAMNANMLEIYSGDKPTCLYNYVNTSHISLLQDAPYSAKVGNIHIPARNHIICYLDRSHQQMMDLLELTTPNSKKIFLPMAGCTISNKNLEEIIHQEKKYDVVVCAGLWNGNPQREWHDKADRVTSVILDNIADYMEKYPVNIYTATKIVFDEMGLNIKIMLPFLKEYLWSLLEYIKIYRRIKAVSFLVDNGIKPDVFGGGWENTFYADKLNIHGAITYPESIKVISQAKILFQDQAEFNDGAHDRVFTAMLNGTVVVSEYSKYLAEEFEDGKDIFLYDWKNGAARLNMLNNILCNKSMYDKIIISAYNKTNERHRWINRAKQIINEVIKYNEVN